MPNPMPVKLIATIRLGRRSLCEMKPTIWMEGMTIHITMLTSEAAPATVYPMDVRYAGAKLGMAVKQADKKPEAGVVDSQVCHEKRAD